MDLKKNKPAFSFALNCSLFGIVIMLASMTAGEIFVSPTLFGGFLSKPVIWPAILAEIITYMIPCLVIAFILLRGVRHFSQNAAKVTVVSSWLAIGFVMALSFKIINYPGDWDFKKLLRPDITFGWTLPCSLILLAYIHFSLDYLKKVR